MTVESVSGWAATRANPLQDGSSLRGLEDGLPSQRASLNRTPRHALDRHYDSGWAVPRTGASKLYTKTAATTESFKCWKTFRLLWRAATAAATASAAGAERFADDVSRPHHLLQQERCMRVPGTLALAGGVKPSTASFVSDDGRPGVIAPGA